jgi:hypothetical protein
VRSSSSRGRPLVAIAICLLALALAMAGCATTRQTRGAEASGFLGDYSTLREGTGDEAQLIYINPEANFSQYQAIMIDSVTLWHASDLSDIPAEQRQGLTDYLYIAMHRELSKDYEIVDHPGPGVMRLRLALTEAKGSKVAANTITTVVPPLKLLTTLGGLATDVAAFVGRCSVEGEIRDSMTYERLMAAVDQRAGTKTLRGVFKKWDDVQDAFDYWAERMRVRLGELQAS